MGILWAFFMVAYLCFIIRAGSDIFRWFWTLLAGLRNVGVVKYWNCDTFERK